MTRIVFQYVLPLLLPTLVFVGWIALTRKPGHSANHMLVRLQEGPWFWLVVAGFALMLAGLAMLGLGQGSGPGGTYHPPHYEGGRVVPGYVE
jgi:hypothetical protein